jgi:hypothetical protein
MSRTVQLSALTITIAILLGVELLGFLGALYAIPVAGILHVIGRDLYDGYRGQLKTEPTIGQQRVPMSSPAAPDRPDEAPPPTLDTPERTSRRDQRSTTRSS